MHSPLEIARTYVDVSIHKTHLSAFKMIILGMFAGIFIGFAGIGSTTASSTVANPSLAKLLGAVVFPAGMAMVLVAGSELFTGNTLIILAVLEKKIPQDAEELVFCLYRQFPGSRTGGLWRGLRAYSRPVQR